MTCRIPGCSRKIHSRGLCNRHYLQYWRRGGFLPPKPPPPPTEQEIELRRQLAAAKRCYDLVVGTATRILWRRIVKLLEGKLR